MEPVDAAYQKLQKLMPEIVSDLTTSTTEADARLRVIDRILIDVLGWPRGDIQTEERADTGYADYVCKHMALSRMVVEAKRDSRTLGVDNKAMTTYKLSGPVFRSEAAKEGITQAIAYGGSKNAELAVVTNGREWIIFRANRLGDGTDTRDGMAFVFPGLAEVESNFSRFFDLLSKESVLAYKFRPYFQEAEGQPIRSRVFSRALRAPHSAHLLPPSPLGTDIDKMMANFFQKLTGHDDPEMIRQCFVETAESHQADRRLARITTDIVDRIQTLETRQGQALTDLIERLQDASAREFVLLVGTKGSGKSTFTKRFFEVVLPRKVAEKCVVVTVDLRSSSGSLPGLTTWLDRQLLDALESSLFVEGPSYAEVQGMFYDEYSRLRRGNWAVLYEKDHDEFQQKFGEKIEQKRTEEPKEYIHGLIRHIINSRNALPVIVFDNTDHFEIEFQQRVYQYARSVYEAVQCLIILPITDRTSWQLSKHGALQSFEHEALYLPTPHTSDVIRKRIDYIESKVAVERGRSGSDYFVRGGITLSVDDLLAFTRTLQKVFVDSPNTSKEIGELANYDVRRMLNLLRKTVTSPHLQVSDLISAFVAKRVADIPQWRITKAIVRQGYDIYPAGQHDYVQNVFHLDSTITTTPLVGLRILQLLRDAPEKEHEGAFLDLDEIKAYMVGMGIESRPVELVLNALVKSGLVLNFDPQLDDVAQDAVEISPAGRRHLSWGSGNAEYVAAMTATTPLLDEATLDEIRALPAGRWRDRTRVFVRYLLEEDRLYCSVPKHAQYSSQSRLSDNLRRLDQQLARDQRPHRRA
jgi:energy-coupling factor transporter ATP-binding protein EcfA2